MKVKLESKQQGAHCRGHPDVVQARKSDLTGSVATVKSKDFNKGRVFSPEQLINGEFWVYRLCPTVVLPLPVVPSVCVVVRLNASKTSSYQCLMVSLEQGGISGDGGNNFLSMIDPSDITVLKDASSTAIYRSPCILTVSSSLPPRGGTAGCCKGELQYHQQFADPCAEWWIC